MPFYNMNLPYRQILGYKGIFISVKVTDTSHIQIYRPAGSAFRMCEGVKNT